MQSICSQVIVPLDFAERSTAIDFLRSVDGELTWVKVGLQMYLKYGAPIIEEIHQMGFRIFLDLKLHDIPNTVAGAIESIASLPVELLTLHISGSYEMLKRAIEARNQFAPSIKLIGVTVLTSMDAEQMNRAGVPGEVPGQVLRLAQLAHRCGLDGIVCSPRELVMLKSNIESDWLYVTPGIRPASADSQDQIRTATPGEAQKKGASYLVIGRPITTAKNPKQALVDIHTELSEFEAERLTE